MSTLAAVAFSAGYRVHYSPWLHPKPRLERTRFSGGVNNSAKERNAARLQYWRASLKILVDHTNRLLVVPEQIRGEFEANLRKAGAA